MFPLIGKAAMRQFDHEKLTVYQDAIKFVAWADDLLADVPKGIAVHNQLDRASTSIPLNIAEGEREAHFGRSLPVLRQCPWIST